jgi:hypothetical protein
MGNKSLYTQITTNQDQSEIWQAISTALTAVGGRQEPVPGGLKIKEGKLGVNFGFTLETEAVIGLRDLGSNRYEIECHLKWKPASIVWICLIVGFFIFGILWIVGLLYLLAKPSEPYEQALHRVQGLLPQPQVQPAAGIPHRVVPASSTAPAVTWSELAPSAASSPTGTEDGVSFCPDCGAKQPKAGARFCLRCGEPLQQAVSEAVDCHSILRRAQEAVRESQDLDVCVQRVVAIIPPNVLEAADSTVEESELYVRVADAPGLSERVRFVYFASLHEACERDKVYRFLHRRGGTIACVISGQMAKVALDHGEWDQAEWAGRRMNYIGMALQQWWFATIGTIFYGLALHGKGVKPDAECVLQVALGNLELAARDAPGEDELATLKYWAALANRAHDEELRTRSPSEGAP